MIEDIMHGFDMTPDDNVIGWFCNEKFDGHRALWDGKRLLTRQGVDYNAPRSFTNFLPVNHRLDCELYAGAGRRDELNGADHWRDKARWTKLRLIVFDILDIPGDYKDRLLSLEQNWSVRPDFITVAVPWVVTHKSQLRRYLRAVKGRGGEGVMLHHPTAPYTAGRTRNLLKLKTQTQLY